MPATSRNPRQAVVREVVAALCVAGPLIVGGLWFRWHASASDAGVYVSSMTGSAEPIDALPSSPWGTGDAHVQTTVLPDGGIWMSFDVVGDTASDALAAKNSARIVCFVMDAADPHMQIEPVDVPVAVTSINPRVYRISAGSSLTWEPGHIPFDQYQAAIGRARGSRSTFEAIVGLVVRDPRTGETRLYAVRLGPPTL